jgi:hypothetical protein
MPDINSELADQLGGDAITVWDAASGLRRLAAHLAGGASRSRP